MVPFPRAGHIYIYLYLSGAVCPSPCINCSTLYATPAGPRGIPERIRRKLYVHFKNTTSTFCIGGIYRYNVRIHVVCLWSHGYSGSQVEKGAPALLQKARRRGIDHSMLLSRPMLRYRAIFVINQVHLPTTTLELHMA